MLSQADLYNHYLSQDIGLFDHHQDSLMLLHHNALHFSFLVITDPSSTLKICYFKNNRYIFIQCNFWRCTLSLNIHLIVIHVGTCTNSIFELLGTFPSIRVYHSWIIHLSIGVYLGCCQFGAFIMKLWDFFVPVLVMAICCTFSYLGKTPSIGIASILPLRDSCPKVL